MSIAVSNVLGSLSINMKDINTCVFKEEHGNFSEQCSCVHTCPVLPPAAPWYISMSPPLDMSVCYTCTGILVTHSPMGQLTVSLDNTSHVLLLYYFDCLPLSASSAPSYERVIYNIVWLWS